MDSQAHHHQLHFILFPLMAQGHMIPMIDMARLFAQRGVLVTIVATPVNILRFKSIIDRAIQSGLPIRILQLRFPCEEVGLPAGCENVDILPSRELVEKFTLATSMLQQPLEESLGQLQPVPSCIISDMFFPWTSETALKFQIPRLIFHGMSSFSLLCSHNILHHNVLENVASESEPFIIPGLPDQIEITKAQLPGTVYQSSTIQLQGLRKQMKEVELTAYGVVVNSFHDLEPKYVEEYKSTKQNKAWCIGPVSLCNKEGIDKAERGNKASIDENQCLKWLNSREPNSVIYVCLGSLSRMTSSQLMEIGLGLKASKHPFVWVFKGGDRYSELEKWLHEEGFEERNKDRCLIIRGWAPQVVILSHPSVGGFLTHCGWNSTLEGVCAGVPMVTWPMFAEQFLNEKLIVQVLGIGVRVGVNKVVSWGEEEKVGVLVKKEEVEKVVNKIMDGSEEGSEERRKRARELGEMAKRAMKEGESSYLEMTHLIQDIMEQASKSNQDKKTIVD